MFLMFFPAKRPRDSFCLLPMGKLSFLTGLAKNNNNGETAKDGLAKKFRWKEKHVGQLACFLERKWKTKQEATGVVGTENIDAQKQSHICYFYFSRSGKLRS